MCRTDRAWQQQVAQQSEQSSHTGRDKVTQGCRFRVRITCVTTGNRTRLGMKCVLGNEPILIRVHRFFPTATFMHLQGKFSNFGDENNTNELREKKTVSVHYYAISFIRYQKCLVSILCSTAEVR